jgi:hypothetical protein
MINLEDIDMKRIIGIALACALAPLASAQVYKSVGPDGKPIYTDQPPSDAPAKQINVSPASAPTQKSAVERDKDMEKIRAEAREKQKKADLASKNTQIDATRCAQAKGEYQTYTEGGRLGTTNEKGERVLMNDAEIEAARVRAKAVMDEACKK